MPEELPPPAAPDLAAERLLLRRSLQRSTAAAVVVLLVAVGLAIAAAVAASRARSSQVAATESLWGALSAEAGSGEAAASEYGSKQRTLEAIDAAVAIRPSPELRDRAIAALARTDIRRAFKIEDLFGNPREPINWAEFSPDFDTVFASDQHGVITQFRLPDGERLKTFSQEAKPQHGGRASYSWISPDGRYLAMRYSWGAAVVWEIDSGKEVFALDEAFEASQIHNLGFHPTRPHWLLISREKPHEVRVYDLVADKTVTRINTDGSPGGALFDHQGKRLAVRVGAHQLQLFDWPDPDSKPKSLGLLTLPDSFAEFDWHPHGDRIACAGADATVFVVEIATGKTIRRMMAHEKYAHYVSYSPSGDLLLSNAWDNTARLWDSESGQHLLKASGVHPMQFSRDGKRIGGKVHRSIYGFEIDRSNVYRPLGVMNGNVSALYNAIAFSADNKLVAGASSYGHVVVWERATGKTRSLRENLGAAYGIAFAENGDLVANCERGVHRWSVSNADGEGEVLSEEVTSVELDGFTLAEGKISADGRWLSALGSDGAHFLSLTDPQATWQKLPARTMTGGGNSNVVVSPDGRFIVCTEWHHDQSEVYAFPGGELVARLDGIGGGAQFSPDSTELAIINKDVVTFWSTADWSRPTISHRPDEAASFCLGINWSRDGRLIAVPNVNGKVQLLDGRDPQHPLLATLRAPFADKLYCAEFSHDGKFLAVGANRSRCHLWNLESLEGELAERNLHWNATSSDSEIETTSASASGPVLLAAVGGLAAILFGLFTVLYQRSLIRRFAAAEAVAGQRAEELANAEIRIAQSEKLKALGTLSAGVAHDFKNLLSVVRLSNDLIRRDAADREDILEEVDAIGNAVAQGDQVVNAMLGYSRSGDESSEIDVSDVIEGTVSLLGQQFLSGVRLELQLDRDLPTVEIPPGALEQILLNLLVNASEAMGGKGALMVDASLTAQPGIEHQILPADTAEQHILVRIADDGPGMDAATLERIFEPFFTTKTVGAEKGTGLGLATVFKIANDNGIGLGVTSSPGEGTLFSLLLPA